MANTARSIKSATKTATVKINQLKVEAYARVKLNEDRIFHFACIFEGDDQTIPPIQVTKDFSVIDGRHRIEGALLAGKTEIRVEFIDVSSTSEIIILAYKANLGGSLPPTKADVILIIKELIESGSTIKEVTKLISETYPEQVAKKFVQEARHGIYRDKVAQAKREIHAGEITMKAAAEKYEIEFEKLVEEMGGKQPKRLGKTTAADIKRDLSTQFRSNGTKVGKLLDRAFGAYEAGDLSKENMLEILDYQGQYISGLARRLEEKRQRFENRTKK